MDEIKKEGFLKRALDKVEVVGNKLPHPVTLFVILIGIVLLLSWIFGGITVVRPGTGGDTGIAVGYIEVQNLLTKEGLQRILTNMVSVFANFAPLGMVLVIMLGIGVAEHTGLIATALKVMVSKVPKSLVTFSIVVAGMLSSVAADFGYVVLIPMGAAIFMGMGRHPLAGLAAAFAGVAGGFGANILPTGLDPMLAAFTASAANILDPAYTVNPLANYYIMAASVPFVGLAGTFVTEKIIIPRLGPYKPEAGVEIEAYTNTVSSTDKRALIYTFIVGAIMIGLLLVAIIPDNGILRGDIDPNTGKASFKPFYDSLVAIMFIIFLISGIVFGIFSKTIKNDKDVTNMTAKSISTMGLYIVIAFVASQFVAYFNWSNLGSVLAVKGSEGLNAIGFTGIPLMVAFIFITFFINMVIGSASAKWALMAPIFVPMFMLMGFSPEVTQAAYRMGDSFSNVLTPLLPYFPLVIVFAQKYVKSVGIGTIISLMLPYSIAFMIVRIPMLVVWIRLNIPLGIEGPIFYTP